MAGGIAANTMFGRISPPSPVQNAYNTYGTAAKTNSRDYEDIMSKYRDVYDQAGGPGGHQFDFNFTGTSPVYQETPEYKSAIANLSTLSSTGGFSPGDIANIRERAISPIRAVYANAQRNVDRQSRLQGGYSPNKIAATAKMARESSSEMSDASTKANAQIAQDVASNKLAASGPLASLTASEQANRNDFALKKADFDRQLDFWKANNAIQQWQFPIQSKLSALGGMTGLYGTTPANASLYGNMALSTAGLQNNINQGNFTDALRSIQAYQ